MRENVASRTPHSTLLRFMCFLLFICHTVPTFAANSSLSDQVLTQITFDQNLNQQISFSLPFRDEHGAQTQLSSCFDQKPVILVLGYYSCPLLCTLTLNGLIESLQDLRLDAGKDFTVINVSIDPNETAALAAAKKRSYLRRYGHGQNERGWRFLTGDPTATHQLADEIGFHYAYDPAVRQYAHPSGFVVLSPGGKVTHYFFGVKYSARELDQALHEAADGKSGSPIEKFLLLCFHYNPITGKYGQLVMSLVRASGVAILLALAWLLTRRKRARTILIPKGAPTSSSDSDSASASSSSAFFASLRLNTRPRIYSARKKDRNRTHPDSPDAVSSACDSPSPGGPRIAKRSSVVGQHNRGGLGKPLGRGEGEHASQTDSMLPPTPHSALRTPHFP